MMNFLDLEKVQKVIKGYAQAGLRTITPNAVAQSLGWTFERSAAALEQYARETRNYLDTRLVAFSPCCHSQVDVTQAFNKKDAHTIKKNCHSCTRSVTIYPEDVFVQYRICHDFTKEESQDDVPNSSCRIDGAPTELPKLVTFPEEAIRSIVERLGAGGLINLNFGVQSMSEHKGDSINLNHVVGPVNIKSKLDNVVQLVHNSTGVPQEKNELVQLIKTLQAELERVQSQRPDEAELVADETKVLAEEIARDKPRKARLANLIASVRTAVDAIGDIAPDAVKIVGRISALLSGIGL